MRTQLRHLLHRRHNHHHPTLPSKPTSSATFTPFPPKPISKITPFHHYQSYHATYAPNSHLSSPNAFNHLHGLFTAPSPEDYRKSKEEMLRKVVNLRDDLVKFNGGSESVNKVLDEFGLPLFSAYSDGSALVELLGHLYDFPLLAVEVFNWRRKHASFSFPMTPEEYAKGIRAAGRAKDVDLAVELFNEAINKRVKAASSYNALMSVYMMNNLPEKCQSLFRELKKEGTCRPTIVTYNILISVFGRLMLIDHMEATLQEIYDSYLIPNEFTFNNLIAGYVTAWMWDRMENAYMVMKERSIEPDTNTYALMLRGYAHSCNIKKMEEMYELLKQHSDETNVPLVRSMIVAYCNRSCPNRVEKIDALMKLIPEEEYRPWLNVLLIQACAQELLLERMENYINVAFQRHTAITTVHVMRSIITAYYKYNAVDKLASFVKRAESAGWRICRSLYHCKMVMYGSQNRLEEMEKVLGEMEKFNINTRTRKTLVIMHKAYSNWGPRHKLEQVLGLMCKHGFTIS